MSNVGSLIALRMVSSLMKDICNLQSLLQSPQVTHYFIFNSFTGSQQFYMNKKGYLDLEPWQIEEQQNQVQLFTKQTLFKNIQSPQQQKNHNQQYKIKVPKKPSKKSNKMLQVKSHRTAPLKSKEQLSLLLKRKVQQKKNMTYNSEKRIKTSLSFKEREHERQKEKEKIKSKNKKMQLAPMYYNSLKCYKMGSQMQSPRQIDYKVMSYFKKKKNPYVLANMKKQKFKESDKSVGYKTTTTKLKQKDYRSVQSVKKIPIIITYNMNDNFKSEKKMTNSLYVQNNITKKKFISQSDHQKTPKTYQGELFEDLNIFGHDRNEIIEKTKAFVKRKHQKPLKKIFEVNEKWGMNFPRNYGITNKQIKNMDKQKINEHLFI